MVDLVELGKLVAQGVVSGFLYGSLIGVVAVGLTLIWGVMKVVNLAHGHLVVLGGMVSAFLFVQTGVNPFIIFVAFLGFGAVMGFILYYTSINRIIGSVDVITLKEEMATLMTTFGFGVTLFGLHYVVNGYYENYSIQPAIKYVASLGGRSVIEIQSISLGYAPFTITVTKVIVALVALVLAIFVHLLLTKTRLGLMIRAVAQDSRALALHGVNPVTIKLATTIVSTSIAVASGVLYIIYAGSITPTTEFILAPLSFVIVVLGGLGSVLGTYIGGVILGVVYQVILYASASPDLFGQSEQTLALGTVFAILLLMLLVRPQGLFGRR